MADIRINSLPTTASASSSDDFLALDGATNGTRKLNAYSPTFGGSATVGDLTLGTSGPSVKSTLSARAPRQGLVFDGTAGATATISALGTAPFTVSAVFSAKSLAANNAIIDDPAIAGILIYVSTAGRVVVLDRVTSTTIYQTAAGVIEVNKLYHITYSRVVGLFINGVNVSGTVTDASNYTSTLYRIGWAASSDSFCTGFLSVLIYNRALSASEVVSLYEAGAPAGADYPARAAGTTLNTVAWINNAGIPYTTFSSSGPTTFTAVKASGTGFANSGTADFWNIKKGDKVLVTGSVALNNGKTILPYVTLYNSGTGAERATGVQLTSSGSFSVTLTANTADSVMVVFSTIGDADYTVSSISVKSLGLLLAPDAAQAGGGLVWYDTSGNAANISWTSGVSWNVPSSRVLGGNWTTSGTLGVSGNTATIGNGTAGADSLYLKLNGGYTSGTNDIAGVQMQLGGVTAAKISLNELVSDTYGIVFATYGSGSLNNAAAITGAGNLLIGTTTDSANGKLQLATHTTSAGGIGFGTDTSWYRSAGGVLTLDTSAGFQGFEARRNGTLNLNFYSNSSDAFIGYKGTGSLTIQTLTGSPALTFDSGQNATFAGQINGDSGFRFRGATGTFYELFRYVGGSNNPGLYVRATEATGTIRLEASGSSGQFPFEIASAGTLAATFNGANATFAGSIAIGNTVNTVSPTSPNRTITMVIGGTTYYIHAKTTND